MHVGLTMASNKLTDYQRLFVGMSKNYGSKYALIRLIYFITKASYFKIKPQCAQDEIIDIQLGNKFNHVVRSSENPDICELDAKDTENHVPVESAIFHKALKAAKIAPHDYTFIDIGSGLGKACLLASQYDFPNILGIELAENLHKQSLDNLNDYTELTGIKPPIQFINSNALELKLPPGNLCIYLNKPFSDAIMEKFLSLLNQSTNMHNHHVVVLNIFPYEPSVFSQFKNLIRVQYVRVDNVEHSWQIYKNRV